MIKRIELYILSENPLSFAKPLVNLPPATFFHPSLVKYG